MAIFTSKIIVLSRLNGVILGGMQDTDSCKASRHREPLYSPSASLYSFNSHKQKLPNGWNSLWPMYLLLLQGPWVVQDHRAGRMDAVPGRVQYDSPNETELGSGALRNSRVWNGVDITHSKSGWTEKKKLWPRSPTDLGPDSPSSTYWL